MKQYMKRVLLVLSMVVSLFALSACSNKNAAEAETMDPQTASYISQISENLLQTIAEMDEATAEESETGRNADVFYGILVNRFHLLCRYCVIHVLSPL